MGVRISPEDVWDVAARTIAGCIPDQRLRPMVDRERRHLQRGLDRLAEIRECTWHFAIARLASDLAAFESVWDPVRPPLVAARSLWLHGNAAGRLAARALLVPQGDHPVDWTQYPDALMQATICRSVTFNDHEIEERYARLEREVAPALADAGFLVRGPTHRHEPGGTCEPVQSDLWVFLHIEGSPGSWRGGHQYARARDAGVVVAAVDDATRVPPCLFTSRETEPDALVRFVDPADLHDVLDHTLRTLPGGLSARGPAPARQERPRSPAVLPAPWRAALDRFVLDKGLDARQTDELANAATRRGLEWAVDVDAGASRRPLPSLDTPGGWLELLHESGD